MPRSGGIYTLPPGYFATDGTTIEVSQHNPPLEDIAQALTDSLPRNGSAPMVGNLPMGGFKLTGLAAATLASDAVRFDQLPTVTPTTATLTAGTNAQGQGPITTDQVTIATAAANPSGVTLPTAVAAKRVIIANRGANPVNIYPATGASIGALAANAPVLLAVNQSVEFFARSATQWEGQISQPLDTDLTAVAGLSTTGLVTRTAAGAMATRQITSTGGTVTITNPAGVAGDINLEVATGWTLVSSSSTWTGGTQTVSGLSGYSRVMVLADSPTATLSGNRRLRVGSGGSILSTSIYVRENDTPQTTFECTTSSTAARSFSMILERFNTTDAAKPVFLSGNAGSNTPVCVTTASVLDRIQVFTSSGDINGGTLYVWGQV